MFAHTNKEFTKYFENLPIKLDFLADEALSLHFHSHLELSFVLKGSFSYKVKDKRFILREKDIILINSFDLHAIQQKDNDSLLLILLIDPFFFKQYMPDFTDYTYSLESIISDISNPLYTQVVSHLARIVLSVIKLEPTYKMQILENSIKIVQILYENFRREKKIEISDQYLKVKRIHEILEYINANYQNDLTLNHIANKFFISPQYLSKSFKEILGIGLSNYISNIRINKSLNLLLGSNKTVEEIATEVGFSDSKNYARAFKKEYGMSPAKYRKMYSISFKDNKSNHIEYYKNNLSNNFQPLFEFLDNKTLTTSKNDSQLETRNINLISDYSEKRPLNKYWKKIASISKASLILRNDIQKQLKIAKRDLDYEYLRFHGIFSDDMMIYREDQKGNPILCWSYIDKVIDFLYSINVKPFIEVGFMPEQLASKHQYAPYIWKPNVSYPKSISKWCFLVSEFIKHCLKRYGTEEVKKWYFEIWNAPELRNIFWFEDDEKFFEFYKETYSSIKDTFPLAKVGTPGVLPLNDYQWLIKFLDFCKKNSINLDFLSTHIYAYTDKREEALPKQFSKSHNNLFVLANEDFLEKTLQTLTGILNHYDLEIPVFITEWNLSPFTVDYNRDTCFLASYIVRNILKNINKVSALCFWTLSDITEEDYNEDLIFHGGLGLFTSNSIKKPAYNAFYLLNKLGDSIVHNGEDYIVTKNNKGFQILLYNFIYFDDLFKSGDRSLLSIEERYNIFKPGKNKNFNILLSLESGTYKIKKYILDRENGSSYDAWTKIGAPREIDNDIDAFLKSKEFPTLHVAIKNIKDKICINEYVPPHGILLMEIEKIEQS